MSDGNDAPVPAVGATRNFSPYRYYLGQAARVAQGRGLSGPDPAQARAWLGGTLAALRSAVGKVPPNAELLAMSSVEGVRVESWCVDVADGLSAVLYVCMPDERDRALPGVLCWAGHDPVDGHAGAQGLAAEAGSGGAALAGGHSAVGLELARAGFIAWSADWMGQGWLSDARMHNGAHDAGDRDWCNIYLLNGCLIDQLPLAVNLAIGRQITRLVVDLGYVDRTRLGVMGLSGGGTLALWSALDDESFRAIDITGYSTDLYRYSFQDLNNCGSQIVPGLFRAMDIPDLQGMLAPRKLLLNIGFFDDCFPIDAASDCAKHAAKYYEAAGVPGHLVTNIFHGDHRWQVASSIEFFEGALK